MGKMVVLIHSITHLLIYSKIKSPLKRLKSFRRLEETFWTLKDVNFEVRKGEVVGVCLGSAQGFTKSSLVPTGKVFYIIAIVYLIMLQKGGGGYKNG